MAIKITGSCRSHYIIIIIIINTIIFSSSASVAGGGTLMVHVKPYKGGRLWNECGNEKEDRQPGEPTLIRFSDSMMLVMHTMLVPFKASTYLVAFMVSFSMDRWSEQESCMLATGSSCTERSKYASYNQKLVSMLSTGGTSAREDLPSKRRERTSQFSSVQI